MNDITLPGVSRGSYSSLNWALPAAILCMLCSVNISPLIANKEIEVPVKPASQKQHTLAKSYDFSAQPDYRSLIASELKIFIENITKQQVPTDPELGQLTAANLWELYDYGLPG